MAPATRASETCATAVGTAGTTAASAPPAVLRERRVAELAQRQYAVISRKQLRSLGFSDQSIAHRLRCGRIHRIYPGVFSVGCKRLVDRGRWLAAVLTVGDDGRLSHISAAALLGITGASGPVHVSTPNRAGRRLPGVTLHRLRHLDPAECTSIDGIRTMTLSRTLLDLAECVPIDRLLSIFAEADRREMVDVAALRATMDRNPGRRGLRPLDDILGSYQPTPGANEGLEREFQIFLQEAGLPRPEVNVGVHGQVVDCYWPMYGLVVELDSKEFHSHWQAAETDRVRDAALLREGIVTLRVTARRLRDEPEEVLADLRSIFARRGTTRGR